MKSINKNKLIINSEIRKKVVIVGDANCGKTSLLSVFTKGHFPNEYKITCFDTDNEARIEVYTKQMCNFGFGYLTLPFIQKRRIVIIDIHFFKFFLLLRYLLQAFFLSTRRTHLFLNASKKVFEIYIFLRKYNKSSNSFIVTNKLRNSQISLRTEITTKDYFFNMFMIFWLN